MVATVDAFTSARWYLMAVENSPKRLATLKMHCHLHQMIIILLFRICSLKHIQRSCPEIISLIEPNLNNKDLRSPMIGFYSHCLLKEGKTKEAKTFFSLAKDKGLSKQVISATLGDTVLVENFLKGTSVLGSLE